MALLAGCTSSAGDDGGSADEAPVERVAGVSFVSRPDLVAPRIEVNRFVPAGGADAGGLFFLGMKGDRSPLVGPLIVDAAGEPVWIGQSEGNVYDVRVQTYRGEPVLTYWRGHADQGHGEGEVVMLDTSYREVGTVTTTGGTGADFHETRLTEDGTALLVSYPLVRQDLSDLVDADGEQGPADGFVLDSVVEEVDVESGRSLLRWSALDHVDLADTYVELDAEVDGSREAPLDFFHVNSVNRDGAGDLLVSGRNTHALYQLDGETGALMWTLGGRNSDFEVAAEARFAWQHDAHRQADGTVTLFDNREGDFVEGAHSRGLRLRLDEVARTAVMVEQWIPADGRLAPTQGNLQVLPDGGCVVGWGQHPSFSEYAADGTLLLDARIDGGQSYRVYRQPWTAQPAEPPTLVLDDDDEAGRRVHLSWNGATEVAAWRVLVGADAAGAAELVTVRSQGFETAVPVPDAPYVAAEALDGNGDVLGTAQP